MSAQVIEMHARCETRTETTTGVWVCTKRPHPRTPNAHGFVKEERLEQERTH